MSTDTRELQDDPLWHRLLVFAFDDPKAARPFSARLAAENGWSPGFTARVLEEYRRFLYLAATVAQRVVPSAAVRKAWHLHLIYTRSYWDALCRDVLGQPLHHHPGDDGSKAREARSGDYETTLTCYERAFGTPPGDIWPARTGAGTGS
jgi:hypothetical protein